MCTHRLPGFQARTGQAADYRTKPGAGHHLNLNFRPEIIYRYLHFFFLSKIRLFIIFI